MSAAANSWCCLGSSLMLFGETWRLLHAHQQAPLTVLLCPAALSPSLVAAPRSSTQVLAAAQARMQPVQTPFPVSQLSQAPYLPQALRALLRACWQPFQALCLGYCPVVTASWLNRCCCHQPPSLQVDTVECWLLQQPEKEDMPPSGRAGSVLDRQGLQFKGLVTAVWSSLHRLRLSLHTVQSAHCPAASQKHIPQCKAWRGQHDRCWLHADSRKTATSCRLRATLEPSTVEGSEMSLLRSELAHHLFRPHEPRYIASVAHVTTTVQLAFKSATYAVFNVFRLPADEASCMITWATQCSCTGGQQYSDGGQQEAWHPWCALSFRRADCIQGLTPWQVLLHYCTFGWGGLLEGLTHGSPARRHLTHVLPSSWGQLSRGSMPLQCAGRGLSSCANDNATTQPSRGCFTAPAGRTVLQVCLSTAGAMLF